MCSTSSRCRVTRSAKRWHRNLCDTIGTPAGGAPSAATCDEDRRTLEGALRRGRRPSPEQACGIVSNWRRPTVTRKKRARKQKVCDDQFLRDVSALVKNASAGKKPRLTKYQATGVQQRLHRLVLDRLPLAEIKRRIVQFNTLSFDRMTYEDIEKAVADVVFVDAGDSEKVAVRSWITDYRNPGLLLYRARKDAIPLEVASDCWSPPPDKARASRLNREGEPLLYTSADGPKVVIDEIGAKPGEAVSIIVYRIRERLKVDGSGCN